MPIVSLNSEHTKSNILVCGKSSLPRAAATLWGCQNEIRYAKSYIDKHLRAVEKFYVHVENLSPNPGDLDTALLKGDIKNIQSYFRTYISELQNRASNNSVSQYEPLRLAVTVVCDVLDEIRHRNGSIQHRKDDLLREIANLKTLYRFLKPSKNQKIKKIRSLPKTTIDELSKYFEPRAPINPFRNEKLQWRNYVIFSIFFQLGLRRAELLKLEACCAKSEFDPYSDRLLYWLNVSNSNVTDTRLDTPQFKNSLSERQIPLSKPLYQLISAYAANWRGKCNHGYLFSSQRGQPLSNRSVNTIFERVSPLLSNDSLTKLYNQCGSRKISPHAFRHSAAVDRMKEYRKAGIEMNKAESLLRVFFGWSVNSPMPRLYARAFYQDQLLELDLN